MNIYVRSIAVADKSAAYCFVKDEDPYKFFGSQTAYNAVRKMDRYTFQMPGRVQSQYFEQLFFFQWSFVYLKRIVSVFEIRNNTSNRVYSIYNRII